MPIQDYLDKVRISVTDNVEFAPVKTPILFMTEPNNIDLEYRARSKYVAKTT